MPFRTYLKIFAGRFIFLFKIAASVFMTA
jgi:hypothetical protein